MLKNTKPVGIVLHVNEELKNTQIDKLESSISNNVGITSVRINPKRNHFLLVDYLPEVVSAREVLGYVHNRGYNAALVGG